jgi:hypothetical protein
MSTTMQFNPATLIQAGRETDQNYKERGSSMDIRAQKIFAWGGLISLLMAIGSLQIAGFLPPPSPAESAEQIATLYRANSVSICIGAIIFLLSTAPFLLFIGVLSVQMRRIEGDRRTFTYIQLASGTASMVPIILAPLAWSVAAFRPEQSPESIQSFNDLGFITMVMTTPMVAVQVLVVGLAILSDKGARPVFPKWFAHASFVCAIGLLTGLLCVLSRTGPLAWNGMIAGWPPSILFLSWTILMTVILLKAIKRQEAEG